MSDLRDQELICVTNFEDSKPDDDNNIVDKILFIENAELIDKKTKSTFIMRDSTVTKTIGSVAYYTITSGFIRKAIFTGALYFAGGTIVSTVGLPAVIIAGTIIWAI